MFRLILIWRKIEIKNVKNMLKLFMRKYRREELVFRIKLKYLKNRKKLNQIENSFSLLKFNKKKLSSRVKLL